LSNGFKKINDPAVAHYQATGRKSLLNIALKNADLLVRDFGYGKEEKYPGHQVVEIGLARLYRATGKNEYLNLAKFFLDVRGPKGTAYNQANQRVTDQHEAVGHAVRTTMEVQLPAEHATGIHEWVVK
jgi:DUF1680 family protein